MYSLGEISARCGTGTFRLNFPPHVLAKAHHGAFPGAGYVRKIDNRWGFDLPSSPRNLRAVLKYFSDQNVDVSIDAAMERIATYDREVGNCDVNYRIQFLDPSLNLPPVPKTKVSPWDCQVRAFWFAVDRFGGLHGDARGGALIGLDMGLGKTSVAILLICNYAWQRTLVICPEKVIPVWPKEWGEFATVEAKVLPLRGSTDQRASDLRRAVRFQNMPLVAVTNYEALDYETVRQAIRDVSWDAVVLDEGHRIKSSGGKRSKWLGKLADDVPCRVELTGTKDPNDPLDIFGQAKFLDRGLFGSRFAQFRSEYAILGPTPSGHIVHVLDYKNEEDLARLNAQICIEVDADEVQDLPTEHHVDVPVILDEATRKQYDTFWEDLVLLFEDDEVAAANALVKVGKAQEITGGYLRNPDNDRLHELGTEKIDTLEEKLSDIDPAEPVVIFYRLKPDGERIDKVLNRLGRKHMRVSGGRNELDEWQRARGGEALVCQISSGKEGVNFTRARLCFYYSLGYQPGEFKQSKKRLNRHGQRSSRVTYFHLVAKGTVDEQIYSAITRKQNVIDRIKAYARKGGVTSQAKK